MLPKSSPSTYSNLKGQRKTGIDRVNTVTNANEAKETDGGFFGRRKLAGEGANRG